MTVPLPVVAFLDFHGVPKNTFVLSNEKANEFSAVLGNRLLKFSFENEILTVSLKTHTISLAFEELSRVRHFIFPKVVVIPVGGHLDARAPGAARIDERIRTIKATDLMVRCGLAFPGDVVVATRMVLHPVAGIQRTSCLFHVL